MSQQKNVKQLHKTSVINSNYLWTKNPQIHCKKDNRLKIWHLLRIVLATNLFLENQISSLVFHNFLLWRTCINGWFLLFAVSFAENSLQCFYSHGLRHLLPYRIFSVHLPTTRTNKLHVRASHLTRGEVPQNCGCFSTQVATRVKYLGSRANSDLLRSILPSSFSVPLSFPMSLFLFSPFVFCA
jgi:hypothetical protein